MKLTFFIILFSFLLFSQENSSYPEIGHNNFGTEFVLTVPPNLSIPNQEHLEFINFIFYSPFDTKVKIEVANKGYVKELSLKANINNGFKIPATIVQPYMKTGYVDSYFDIVVKNSAIKITSEYPISVLVLSDFDNSGDSYLAIPKQHLGNEYVVSSYTDVSDFYKDFTSLKSNVSLVATEDSTVIEFFYPAENTIMDVKGIEISGETFTKKLNKNDIWIMSSVLSGDDLSNARIKSNKPISVISSNQCANIPSNTKWCNFIMNMETPTEYWGYSYVVSKYEYKKYEPVIRIYAKENNTDIYVDGVYYETILNVYDKTKKSFIELPRTNENNFDPFIISSDKPILVSSYSTGDEEDLKPTPNGGPSMLNIPSIESMTNFINVSSPNYAQDVSFNENYVNLLFELDESNDVPVSFEYGFLEGKRFNWYKVKNSLNITYAKKISNPHNNKTYGVIGLKLPSNGNIKFRSDYKFTMINYGFNEFKSYAFQSLYNLVSNEITDLEAPIINWEISCDSKIIGEIIEENLKGNLLIPDSNLVNMKVIDRSVNPAEFEIDIIDINKPAAGTIKVWDVYGNISEEKIIYSPKNIRINPKYIEINEKINNKLIGNFEIENLSDTDYYLKDIITEINEIEFKYNGVEISELDDPIKIVGNSSIYIEYSGMFSNDTIVESKILLDDGCFTYDKSYIKINIETPQIYVSDVNFQDVSKGQNQIKNFAIYNRSNVPLTITDIIYPNIFDFEVPGLPIINDKNPLIIAPKSDYKLEIILKSNKIGNLFDSLKVVSDAPTYDNVCYIYARILEPGLVCEAFDFGRREVYNSAFNDVDYIIDTIKIWNYGSKDLIIKNLNVINSNSDYFEIEDLRNKLVEKNKFINYFVRYKPLEVGNHHLEIKVNLVNDIETNSNIRLSGIGVLSKIKTADTLDFGNVYINTSETKFINLLNEEYEFSNDLSKLLLKYDINSLNSNYFIFNENETHLEINESKEFEVKFEPKKLGYFETIIELLGNYDGNREIILRGVCVDSRLEILSDKFNSIACEGEKDTLTVKIKNNGTSTLILEPLRFDPIVPEYSFLQPELSLNEFQIEADSTKEIKIEFTSFGNDRQIDLILKDKTKLLPEIIELTGNNKLFENVYEIKPLKQSVEVSQPALSKIILEGNQNIDESDVKDLRISVSYDPSILSLQDKTITLSSQLKNKYEIENIEKIDNGKYQFDLLSLGDWRIDKDMELASFIFNTYLSNSSSNVSKVKIDIVSKNSDCVNFKTSEDAEIETLLNCAEEFQKVNSTLIPFNISEINPNPINSNLNVDYSFPFDSEVKIALYDINGSEVRNYVDEFKNTGFYYFDLNIDNLSNGYYFIIYSAGDFNKRIPLIINK